MNLVKLLSNSVRVQIVQYLQIHNEATTKQISEALSDISAPTLYRHINALLNEEILIVKEERKVRGSLERLLIINKQKFTENNDISDTAYQFLMELYSKFHIYADKEDIDPVRDKLSLRTSVLNLNDNEFDEFMNEIADIMKKYQNKPLNEKSKKRSISFISAPVKEMEK